MNKFVSIFIVVLFCAMAGAEPPLPQPFDISITSNGKEISEENQSRAKDTLVRLQAHLRSSPQNPALHLDLDNELSKAVMSLPGFFSDADCLAGPKSPTSCRVNGTVTNKTDLIPTGRVEFKETENSDGERLMSAYLEVRYFEKGQPITGWMPREVLNIGSGLPFFAELAKEKISALRQSLPEYCDNISKTPISQPSDPLNAQNVKNLRDTGQVLEATIDNENNRRKSVADAVQALSGKVGMCSLNPPNQIPRDLSNPVGYDQEVLPLLRKQSVPVTKPPMDRQKMEEIDALARTVFAEMASCVPIGAQYTMAVARVIRNRQLAADSPDPTAMANGRRDYIWSERQHDTQKSTLTKVATSPVQFSAWNRNLIDSKEKAKYIQERARSQKISTAKAKDEVDREEKEYLRGKRKMPEYYKVNESGMFHTFCPPSDPNQLCYTGKIPDLVGTKAWQDSIRVATEAVLFPKEFEDRTKEVGDVNHYTSGRKSFSVRKKKYVQVNPSIDGHPIDSDKCLNLWVPPDSESGKVQIAENERKQQALKNAKAKSKRTKARAKTKKA